VAPWPGLLGKLKGRTVRPSCLALVKEGGGAESTAGTGAGTDLLGVDSRLQPILHREWWRAQQA
jgi:hypothetical protein